YGRHEARGQGTPFRHVARISGHDRAGAGEIAGGVAGGDCLRRAVGGEVRKRTLEHRVARAIEIEARRIAQLEVNLDAATQPSLEEPIVLGAELIRVSGVVELVLVVLRRGRDRRQVNTMTVVDCDAQPALEYFGIRGGKTRTWIVDVVPRAHDKAELAA